MRLERLRARGAPHAFRDDADLLVGVLENAALLHVQFDPGVNAVLETHAVETIGLEPACAQDLSQAVAARVLQSIDVLGLQLATERAAAQTGDTESVQVLCANRADFDRPAGLYPVLAEQATGFDGRENTDDPVVDAAVRGPSTCDPVTIGFASGSFPGRNPNRLPNAS